MSRQSGTNIDRASRTVSSLGSWAITKPVAQQSLDFLNTRLGVTPPEILAHQIEPGVEQIERRAERDGEAVRLDAALVEDAGRLHRPHTVRRPGPTFASVSREPGGLPYPGAVTVEKPTREKRRRP